MASPDARPAHPLLDRAAGAGAAVSAAIVLGSVVAHELTVLRHNRSKEKQTQHPKPITVFDLNSLESGDGGFPFD